MPFTEIKPTDIKDNIIEMISKEWMLISAGDESNCNMMTASWGFMGEIWGKDCAVALIRPQRYTLDFVEKNDTFSLCFFGDNKEPHKICGYKSGRDINKVAETGLTVRENYGTVYFEEARLVLICHKLYVSELKESCFTDKSLLKWYPDNDFHKVFIGEVEKVLVRG